MLRLKNFFKTTLLGGVTVLLPVVLTYFFLRWVFNFVRDMVDPLSKVVVENHLPRQYIWAAHLIVLTLVVCLCFFVGLIVKTRFGGFIYHIFEKKILKIAPGYTIFRETIKQFLGQERTPFSRVALVRIFNNDTLTTAFITDEHPDGYYSVYVPSGLNPTTGLIYHLRKENVFLVEASVEETMRSIISCGAGSRRLIDGLPEDIRKGSGTPVDSQRSN